MKHKSNKNIIHPIRHDYLSGMSFVGIGKKYDIDQRTAKRYALQNIPLEHLEQRPFTSVLDPYKTDIDKWLLDGLVFATTIHDRLIEKGCMCSYTIVNDYVRKKIDEYEKSGIYNEIKSKNKEIIPLEEKAQIEKKRRKVKYYVNGQ